MVIPTFDMMRDCFGMAPCPTCSDRRMVFVATGTVSSKTDEEVCREKLYGEYYDSSKT